MTSIIPSLSDTDLHKFTMLQVMLHQLPQTHSVYEFRYRDKTTVYPLADIRGDFERELGALCILRFQGDGLDYLHRLCFTRSDFADYLELFQLKRHFVTHWSDEKGRLNIQIEGSMTQAMFFEIYILFIVNELYFHRLETPEVMAEGEHCLQEKAGRLKELTVQQNPAGPLFLIFGFSTRRHYNLAWQEYVIRTLLEAAPDIVRGTSSVYLTEKLGIAPIGMMACEFLQAFQAFDSHLHDFQRAVLESWVHEYRGDSGIALANVVGMDTFLCDFDLYFAKLFDGLRHDSDDSYEWGDRAYAHYKKLKTDSRIKMLTFSDGLGVEHSWALYQYFRGHFKTSLGISTNPTSDMGYVPLNIVPKLVECNGQSMAKLSNTPGKIMTTNNTFPVCLRQVSEIPESEPEDG